MKRITRYSTASFAATLLAGTALFAGPVLAQSGMNTTSLQHEIVLDGLENP